MMIMRASDGTEFIIDMEDYLMVSKYRWQTLKTKYGTYIRRRDGKKTILLHNQINQPEKGMVTDHINRNRLDNRRSNLRTASRSQNSINTSRITRSTVYRGISRSDSKKSWRARIVLNGREQSLGSYDCPILAALAYDKAAADLHGKFACLNFGRL